MLIKKYEATNCNDVRELFYNTVHCINSKDYTKEQLNVWARKEIDLNDWNQSLLANFSVIALKKDTIVGFGDIDKTGYLDRLYVHKNYQSQGIATEICKVLEEAFDVERIITHASITAKPFFEKRGYKVIKKQSVERFGVLLDNYFMEKRLK